MMGTVYHSDYRKDSPGSIAMMLTIEHLLNVDNICEMDFGTDDNPYKATWVAQRRERWGAVAFNLRTFHGALGVCRFDVVERVARARRILR